MVLVEERLHGGEVAHFVARGERAVVDGRGGQIVLVRAEELDFTGVEPVAVV